MKKSRFIFVLTILLLITGCNSGISKERESDLISQLHTKSTEISSLKKELIEMEKKVNVLTLDEKYSVTLDLEITYIFYPDPDDVYYGESLIIIAEAYSFGNPQIYELILEDEISDPTNEKKLYSTYHDTLKVGDKISVSCVFVENISNNRQIGKITKIH